MGAPEAPGLGERQRTMAWLAYLFAPVLSVVILVVARPDERFVRWHAIHAFALGILLVPAVWVAMLWLVFQASADPTAAVIFGLRALPVLVLVAIISLMFAAYHGKKWGVPGLTFFANRFA